MVTGDNSRDGAPPLEVDEAFDQAFRRQEAAVKGFRKGGGRPLRDKSGERERRLQMRGKLVSGLREAGIVPGNLARVPVDAEAGYRGEVVVVCLVEANIATNIVVKFRPLPLNGGPMTQVTLTGQNPLPLEFVYRPERGFAPIAYFIIPGMARHAVAVEAWRAEIETVLGPDDVYRHEMYGVLWRIDPVRAKLAEMKRIADAKTAERKARKPFIRW